MLVKSVKKFVMSVTISGDNSIILLRGSLIQILGHQKCCKMKELRDQEILDVKCGKQFTISMTLNELYFWGTRMRLKNKEEESDKNPCVMLGDIAIGNTNSSLMDIVQEIGPDYPVIQVRDPKITVETMADLEALKLGSELVVTDNISKPQAIISLYSCQMSKKHSQFIQLSQIYCFPDESVWIVFDSNLISTSCEADEVDDRTLIWSPVNGSQSSESQVPDWIQRELEEADRPKQSVTCHSDPTFDRSRNETATKLKAKLALADEEMKNLRRQKEELQIQVTRLQKRLRDVNNCCVIL